MVIGQTELEQIGSYIKGQLSGWLDELRPRKNTEISVQLLERMVRVEEEIGSQRRLMEVRFEATDRRFDDMLGYMNRRFDAVDRRFGTVQWLMGIGFIMVGTLITVFGVIA